MNSSTSKSHPTVCYVPLGPAGGPALAVCAVVVTTDNHRTVPVVRLTSLATAYLGAVCDAQGKALDWLELWFQRDPDDAQENAGTRWHDVIRRWEDSPSSGFLKTGWEKGLPHPLVLATDLKSWISFTDPVTAQPLRFCRDDAELTGAGLPAYSSGRAIFVSGDTKSFFQASGQAVEPRMPRVEDLLPTTKPVIKISLGGRSLAVRRLAPLALGDFADVLSGNPLRLEGEGKDALRLSFHGHAGRPLSDFLADAQRSLLRARAGRREWAAEIIALKMRALCQAIRLVHDGIRVSGEPFLSLSEHAFAVRFGLAGPPLQLWDFEVVLHATGCAAIRQAAGAKLAWRTYRESQMPAAYERVSAVRAEREVECRLRLVTRQESGLLVEATLGRCDQTAIGGLLGCLHLPLANGRLVLWGRLSRDNSLAREEIRFRSFPTEMDAASGVELERMQGFLWNNVLLETLPTVGYGDDLHSLGVLAVRLLLTAEPAQLPSALDAIFSVIEKLRETRGAGPLAEQLRAAFQLDPRFNELLHAGRALAFPISADEANAGLGASTWWEVLAFVVRLFPTDLAPAFCRLEHAADLGAFPRAFDEALNVAEALNRKLTDQVMPHETVNARVRAITATMRRPSSH